MTSCENKVTCKLYAVRLNEVGASLKVLLTCHMTGLTAEYYLPDSFV